MPREEAGGGVVMYTITLNGVQIGIPHETEFSGGFA